MPTSNVTKVDENLTENLAMYGLVRSAAERGAPISTTKANFFGLENKGESVELLFTDDIEELADSVDDGMQLSQVAPENEPFNMLMTRDFKKAIKSKDETTIREFLRSLLDDV